MAWPKKHTRRIRINNREWLWHISGGGTWAETPITVGIEEGRYVFHIDPYAHDLDITPSMIRHAIEWALAEGWSPEEGPIRSMAYSDETHSFYWLPSGARYAREVSDDGQHS
ncbi:MAG: hypothetical protein DHS20C16_19410 [Phycisphaerae bacterium]|nr:MAG: hypothetical protein DHS20C16_19410 [Phycisphaerae bacterium]